MTLIRTTNDNDLFGRRFSDIMDEFFNDAVSTRQNRFVPGIDVAETDNAYEIQVQLPGIKKEDISVNLENNVLTVSGERKFEEEQKEKKFHRIESRYGAFTRSFQLPDNINPDSTGAAFEDGILKISVEKSEDKLNKQIKVT